jgi:hypothetical protein
VVFGDASGKPELFGFVVGLQSSSGVAFEVGDVESRRVQAIDLGQKLPRVFANSWSARECAK